MVRKLNTSILYIIGVLTLTSCSMRRDVSALAQQQEVHDSTVIILPTTPVRNQGTTSACWIYAMLACIETDRMANYGDSVGLSAEWLIMKNREEMERHYRLTRKATLRGWLRQHLSLSSSSPSGEGRGGACEVGGGSSRGLGPDALRLIRLYGLIPDKTRPGADDGFYLYSMHYTPQQFAGSVYQEGDWQWFTSVEHHEYNRLCCLEVPDNTHYNEFMNVKRDSLLALTVNSLRNNHPVFWEGAMADVHNGTCRGKFADPILRDDHAMAIVGMRFDKHGQPVFLVKNSWGKEWGNHGYCTMTAQEFLDRTLIIGVKTLSP